MARGSERKGERHKKMARLLMILDEALTAEGSKEREAWHQMTKSSSKFSGVLEKIGEH